MSNPASHAPEPPVSGGAACSPVEHRKAWEKNFITPIANTMKKRGVAYMVIILRDDGKATYVLDTEPPEND